MVRLFHKKYIVFFLKSGIMTIIKMAIVISLVLSVQRIAAQKDSTTDKPRLSGVVIITSNGISQIPAYSLNKPAISAFFILKIKRLSYEPDINYGMDGRPWGMGNTFMYLITDKKKLKFKSGLSLGLAFSYPDVLQEGKLIEVNKAERYLIVKIIPSYLFSKRSSLALIYWNAHNLEKESIKLINFLSAVVSIINVPISNNIHCSFFPQVFYLNVDGRGGLFFSPSAGFGLKKFPLSLSSQVNTTLITNMRPSPGTKWNVALNYNF